MDSAGPDTPEPGILTVEDEDSRPLAEWTALERDRLLKDLGKVLDQLKVLSSAVEGLRPIVRMIRVPGGLEDQLDGLIEGEFIPVPPGNKQSRGVPLTKEQWQTIFQIVRRIQKDQWTDSVQDLVTMAIGPEF
jgi:hypothetical protein